MSLSAVSSTVESSGKLPPINVAQKVSLTAAPSSFLHQTPPPPVPESAITMQPIGPTTTVRSSTRSSRYLNLSRQAQAVTNGKQEQVPNKPSHSIQSKQSPRKNTPRRRVASARTSREQDTADAKGEQRRNAAIAAVKKALTFGFVSKEVSSSQLDVCVAVNALDDRELKRLMAVHAMKILNQPREPRLENITSLTARILNADICAITVIDADWVRFLAVYDSTKGRHFGAVSSNESNASSSSFDDDKPAWCSFKEPRAESFCQYTVRDGGNEYSKSQNSGFVVLDASREPKFKNRPLVKSGLHFYAGAPLSTKSGVKIGSLSIRGPARHQFTSQEAKILRQMTEWAVGEIELYIAKRDFDYREVLRLAQRRLMDMAQSVSADTAFSLLTQDALHLIKQTLKLKNCALFTIKKNASGAMRSTVYLLAAPCETRIGEEKFTELCQGTLDKPTNSPFILDTRLKSSSAASHLQVHRYFGNDVSQIACDLVWSHGRPVAVLAIFFEGEYRSISPVEEQFLSSCASAISAMWERRETVDSLAQIASVSATSQALIARLEATKTLMNSALWGPNKSQGALDSCAGDICENANVSLQSADGLYFANRSNSVATLYQSRESLSSGWGSMSSLYFNFQRKASIISNQPLKFVTICLAVVESILPTQKDNIQTSINLASHFESRRGSEREKGGLQSIFASNSQGRVNLTPSTSNAPSSILKRSSINLSKLPAITEAVQAGSGLWGGSSGTVALTPNGSIDLLMDFSQMFDIVADQRGIRWTKKYGSLFLAATGISLDDTKANHLNLINTAIDLMQTIEEYAAETGISVAARVGIHGVQVPISLISSKQDIESMWEALVNFTYQLQRSSSTSIQISDFIHSLLENSAISSKLQGTTTSPTFGVSKVYSISYSQGKSPMAGGTIASPRFQDEAHSSVKLTQIQSENRDSNRGTTGRYKRKFVGVRSQSRASRQVLPIDDATDSSNGAGDVQLLLRRDSNRCHIM